MLINVFNVDLKVSKNELLVKMNHYDTTLIITINE